MYETNNDKTLWKIFFSKNSLKSKFIPKFCCRENKFRLKKKKKAKEKNERKKYKKEIEDNF